MPKCPGGWVLTTAQDHRACSEEYHNGHRSRREGWHLRKKRKASGRTKRMGANADIGISGKSSLAASLFRVLDIDEGAITIDELDISKISPELLRSKLVTVPQETCILSGTVRFNVDPNSSFGDAAIIQALEQVRLWPTLERRGGLDAEVGDAFFSQGQCRLLGCARTALRKSQILVLDEATSR